MSRKFYFEGIMLILLVLAGCQNEKYVDDSSSHTQMFTLTASKGVSSRIHLGADGKQSLWSEGDEIFVSSTDGKVTGVLKLSEDDANQTSGTFSGLVTGDPSTLAYSVFPVPNSDDMTIDMSQVIGGDKLDAPMVGQIDFEKRSVAFKNSCGMIRLNLQNANGKDFTISAKNGENSVKFLTTATVNVDEYGVAILDYSASGNGTISLENAVGGFMYIPYYIEQDVTIFVDNLEVVTAEVANFKGIIKQKNVKTLTYSETTASLIAPATAEIKNENIEGETLKVDVSTATSEPSEGSTTAESHEFVNIPSITEALTDGQEGAEVEITEVVIELPKIEQTSVATKSVVSFEEIPQGVTVTIQEEDTENKSIEELTVILPSTATEADANEAIAINMPNTTVTVKSTDGKTLYIKDVIAETYDQTLVVDQNVEITSLTILKGGVQVFGQIGQLMRDAENKDEVTLVTIEVGGRVGQIEGEGFEIVDKNVAEEDKDNVVIKNAELSAALLGILGSDAVKIDEESGFALMSQKAVDEVYSLSLDNDGETPYSISSLNGIENFKELTYLSCNSQMKLMSCDLSQNTKLQTISFQHTGLTSCDLSNNINLTTAIFYYSNNLASLNISEKAILSVLNITGTSLNNENLTITDDNIANIIQLEYGYTSGVSFDLSKLYKLEYLDCSGTTSDFSTIPNEAKLNMWVLNCEYCSLTEINLSEYPKLLDLVCTGNQLTELKVELCKDLAYLRCAENQLTSLNLSSPSSSFRWLECGNQKDKNGNNINLQLNLNTSLYDKWYENWLINGVNDNVFIPKTEGNTGGSDFPIGGIY